MNARNESIHIALRREGQVARMNMGEIISAGCSKRLFLKARSWRTFSASWEGGAVKAKSHVTLKQGLLDPQGKAIEHALGSLGFKNAGNVRVGKYMEVEVNETDKAKADAAVKAMCEKLLANTIVEEFTYELQ